MGKSPFITGAYRPNEDATNLRPQGALVRRIDTAIQTRRHHDAVHKPLHQKYDTPATVATQRVAKRMFKDN